MGSSPTLYVLIKIFFRLAEWLKALVDRRGVKTARVRISHPPPSLKKAICSFGGMVYTVVLGTTGRKVLRVRVSQRAPNLKFQGVLAERFIALAWKAREFQ